MDTSSVRRGIAYLLSAALFFSLMSLFVKLAGERLPSPLLVLARALVTLIISLALLRRAKIPPFGHHKRLLLLRGMLGFLGLMFFFYAITTLPLAEVTVIHYLNPLFTGLLAALVLKERMGAVLWIALLVGLVGVVFVARPGFLFSGGSTLPPLGVAAALAGSVAAAGAYTTVRHLRKSDHPLVIVFYFSLVSVPASLPLVIPIFVWPRGFEWLWLLAIGLTTQIAQLHMTRGLSLVPAGPGTAVGYVQIAFAAAWGALLFDERPGLHTVLGTVLVLVATLLVAFSARKASVSADTSAVTP